ncbi:MAG TPA: substrate-binding domain-containing protein [Bauldia sp.]|nr:substrate-binding domain-containing protein [Bauldia sp.]
MHIMQHLKPAKLIVLAALALGIGTTSALADAAAGQPITFVSPLIGHPVWLQARDAFLAKAKDLGMQATWTGPQGVDIPAMVQQIEGAIASGAKGIVTCALDPGAFDGVLSDAKKANVPVVLTDCDSSTPDERLAFVGTIGSTFGAQSGQKLADMTGGKANIIIMQGSLDAKIQNDIKGGFLQAIAEHPDMKVIATDADDSSVETAVSKFEALLRTNPQTTVIYCIEASCAGAAATVAEEQGLLDKLTIFGTDDTAETLAGIRAGKIEVSAAQAFPKMGSLAAQYLADHFNGKDVPSVTDTGAIFITKDNVDSYLTGK